jgi:hypothetical protein
MYFVPLTGQRLRAMTQLSSLVYDMFQEPPRKNVASGVEDAAVAAEAEVAAD